MALVFCLAPKPDMKTKRRKIRFDRNMRKTKPEWKGSIRVRKDMCHTFIEFSKFMDVVILCVMNDGSSCRRVDM